MWIIDINIIIKAEMKWIEKNRLIKILLINLFPQIINIILFPIIGIILIKLVITVIAQYDICLLINEYPKNEIIINKINIIIPVFHIFLFL